MSWNYRMVHTRTGAAPPLPTDHYAIYEVYYTDQGQPAQRTATPAVPAGETLDELREDLAQYLRAAEAPILEDTLFQAGEDMSAPRVPQPRPESLVTFARRVVEAYHREEEPYPETAEAIQDLETALETCAQPDQIP